MIMIDKVQSVSIKIFDFNENNEHLFCCCSLGAFEKYGLNAHQYDDVIKGISTDREEAAEDFCINYSLATQQLTSIDID